MPPKQIRKKKKTLKINAAPAKLMMQKLINGDFSGDEKYKDVYDSEPV